MSGDEIYQYFVYKRRGTLVRCRDGVSPFKKDNNGYWRATVKKRHYSLHRLVWQYHYGPIPPGLEIDHKDTDKDNNRIGNLRLCDSTKNKLNTHRPSNNTSKIKGVNFCKNAVKKPWVARIQIYKTRHFLGYFDTKTQAAKAYEQAIKKYGGEFAKYDLG